MMFTAKNLFFFKAINSIFKQIKKELDRKSLNKMLFFVSGVLFLLYYSPLKGVECWFCKSHFSSTFIYVTFERKL